MAMLKRKPKIVINIQKEINPTFESVWTTKKPYNILKGGRNSFKSSVIALKLVYEMLKYIRRGEKANVVVLRKTATSIRDSVFNKIQWALRKLGVIGRFNMTVAPFRITDRVTGSTFYFYGNDDFNKIKGNDIEDIIAVWYEESAEFDSGEDFDQNFATFARQKQQNADMVYFFWSYNPPRNPYAWINEWVDTKRGHQNYLIHESSYLDDELGFVTDQMLDHINEIKENDFDYYRYIYLGEAVGLGTNIYNMNLFKMIDELPDDDPIVDVCYSADTGHQTSATSVECWGITARGNVILIDTYYYRPQGRAVKKAPSELAEDVYSFVKEKGYYVYKYTIDSAEGGFRNQYFKDYGERWHGVAKKEKHIMIDHTHDLLAQGRVYVINTKNNQIFLEECKRYEWDERTIHTDQPKPIKEHDDTVDSFQYFVMDNLRRLRLKQ